MDIKVETKEEGSSELETDSSSQGFTMKMNNNAAIWNNNCEMGKKTEIKEEPLASDFGQKNEMQFFFKDDAMKVKDCEMDTKIDVKENLWCLETTSTEAPYVDVTKDLQSYDCCSANINFEHLIMDTQKRNRGNNFSYAEKAIFVNILEKYVHIIENKKTDAMTLKQKEDAWGKLCLEFNSSLSASNRSVKQLKSFYDNFKRKSKKNYADEKVDRMRTGGGTAMYVTDENSTKLLSLLKDQIIPLHNSKDSDALYHEDHTFAVTKEDTHIPFEIIQTAPGSTLESQAIMEESPTSETDLQNQLIIPLSPHIEHQSFTTEKTPSWVSRNRTLKQKESQTLRCRKTIVCLAEKRKKVIELECEVIKERERKEDELRALRLQAQEKKIKACKSKAAAYEAKRQYYERKLALIP